MCGIVGIIDISGKPIAPKQIIDMSSAMAHRGPDDEGYCLINQSDSRSETEDRANSRGDLGNQNFMPAFIEICRAGKR